MLRFKGLLRIIFGRTAIFILAILSQLAILLVCFSWLSEYMVFIYGGFTLLSAVILIYILNEETNASFKMAWMTLVLLIPIFGALCYIFLNFQWQTKVMKTRLQDINDGMSSLVGQEKEIYEKIQREDIGEAGLMSYLIGAGGFPVYENTAIGYFALGEEQFKEILAQIKKAKKFIFMEYFIVSRGYMWNTIFDILKEKVKEGVEVRFMYDGMCSLMLLPYNYPKEVCRYGINCKMFSPMRPVLSSYQNNRDHRKILVIDGHTAFTGGINLSDEYINEKVKFGHWKDTGIIVQGAAVKRFTLMFLEMWNVSEKAHEDYSKYVDIDYAKEPEIQQVINDSSYRVLQSGKHICEGGYTVPFGDRPYNGEDTGKQVYIDILNRAERYVHIMTPYLILDDEVSGALKYCAKRGVDTVIIMPHVPDKIYAYLLARTYYKELIQHGVKIYEYTPGFIHAKSFVSDDKRAVVGTFNLDFRSLYLHFECAAYIYKNPSVALVEKDFQKTVEKCHLMTLEGCKNLPLWKKIMGRTLRIIAPLM